jgi:hypothetical protein
MVSPSMSVESKSNTANLFTIYPNLILDCHEIFDFSQ